MEILNEALIWAKLIGMFVLFFFTPICGAVRKVRGKSR